MKPLYKGLLVAAVHIAIVTSLGAKLLYDRNTRPRVWARTASFDPELPIRGRYVSLRLEVVAPDLEPPKASQPEQRRAWRFQRTAVTVSKDGEQLVARRDTQATPQDVYRGDQNALVWWERPNGATPMLADPVLFFIPEHVPDPSRRPQGEELWVEVTIPKKGPPRPIRLAVKKGAGPLVPLDLR